MLSRSRCDTPLVNESDQARLPVFQLLLVVQGLAAVAAAATTFAVLLIWLQRSAQEGPR
jgi:hypothetical protein